jgi:Protein of unknown function (DUF2568)
VSERPTPGHGPAVLSTPGLVVLAVVAFAVELALFGGVGAIAYAAVGEGPTAWLAALAGTAAVVLLWALFMAPKARFRLPAGARLVVAAALCLGTAYGLVTSGFSVWGWFVGVAGLAVVAAQVALPTAPGERP